MNIFELTEKQNDILNRLLFADDSELESLEHELDSLKYDAGKMINFLSSIYAEANAIADSREERAKSLTEQAKSARNKADLLKAKITRLCVQFDIKRIETQYFNIRLDMGRESIPDYKYNEIPELNQYFETITTHKLDKAKLKNDLKLGINTSYAEIVKKPFVVMK